MFKGISIVPRSLIFVVDLICSFLALLFSIIFFHHFNFGQLQRQISDLKTNIENIESEMGLVAKIKEIIHEYIINNSIFEKLDNSDKLISLK
jgi:hypothetical protein